MAFGNRRGALGTGNGGGHFDLAESIGVRSISLADTVGTATSEAVGKLYSAVKDGVAGIELGIHLHSRPEASAEKVMAAYNAGCRRFIPRLPGWAAVLLPVTNWLATSLRRRSSAHLEEHGIETGLALPALAPVLAQAAEIRDHYAHE